MKASMSPALPIFALLLSGSAHAQDAIKLEVIRTGQKGTSKPGLILLPQMNASALDVRIDCGGAWAEHKGSATKGNDIRLELDVNPGVWPCTGKLSGTFQDGSSGDMPLSFEIEMLGPLGITVDKAQVDLTARTMQVRFDRPVAAVEVLVLGPGKSQIGFGETKASGVAAGTPVKVSWTQGLGEVLIIEVKATDSHGFWSKLELSPWFYNIPHEDVVFESAKADIRPMEAGKLESALTEVNKVVAKYGGEVPTNLYVGGYTDTVGDNSINRFLSANRAAAIAKWFQAKGFKGEIWYQGFGEEGLAVPTPDEVDELRNRRAVYIIAAEAPPVTRQMPGSEWKRLQ